MVGSYTLYVSLPLVFISFIVLMLTYFTKKEDPAHRHFYFLCITILLWNILHAAFSASLDMEMIEFFFTAQMLAIPYMPVALLVYVLKFSGFEKAVSFKYIILICILPTITVIMNFTNDFHYLFRINFAVLATTPVRVFINERGPWFWVHSAYSYAAIIASNVIVIYKIRRVVNASRLRYYMILLGSTLTVAANLFVLFVAPSSPIDSTLWGATFGLFFMYFAMDTSPTSNYILARNQVFEAIGEYIFVLNANNGIIDINSPARSWLVRLGINSDPATLDLLLVQLQQKGAVIEKDEDTGHQEIFFLDEENSLFSSYAIKSNYIYGKKKAIVGTIVTFSDMTLIRETLRDLQAVSTIDELTGTYNRRSYERMLAGYDSDNVLPLCIIMGDVNGLKRINDTLGHGMGDDVLRGATRILVECTGEQGAVARIGGDEFAIVIPYFDNAAAEVLIENIKQTFADKADKMYGAGIALGYAIKTEPDQDVDKIRDEADMNMYQDKRNDRRR